MGRIIKRTNLAPPVFQYATADGKYVWDFAWPEVTAFLEVSGWDGHAAYDDWVRNMEKRNWAAEHGCLVLDYGYDHLRKNGDMVGAQIERILTKRRLQLGTHQPEL